MIEVKQRFIGEVFGNQTDNQAIFWAMDFLYCSMLENENQVFGSAENSKIDLPGFMGDLMCSIEKCWRSSDAISIAEIENELGACILDCDCFERLKFNVFGSEWRFETLNENIKNGKYFLSKE